ncbi:MAG: translocation/assembly module TamB domain-containing protein, partial [Calditrichota bacterium]
YGLNRSFNASVRLITDELTWFEHVLPIPQASGNLTARLQMQGTLDSTAVKGGISLTDFKSRQIQMDTLVSYLNFTDLQHLEGGNLFIEARGGTLFGRNIQSGNLSMESTQDSIFVHNFQLSNPDGNLYLTGKMAKSLVGSVNTFQVRYKDVLLHNRTALPFRITDQGLEFDRGVLGINDGFIGVSGVFRDRDSLQGKVDITNLDLAPLNKVLVNNFSFTGKVNGEIEFRRIGKNQAIQANLDISNAIWHDLHYDRLQCRGNYYQGMLALTRVYLETPEGATINISGKIPLKLETSLSQDALIYNPNEQMSANIELQDIFLEDYAQFLPLKQKIAGKISGEMAITGTMDAPKSTMHFTVADPKFDRVGGEELQVDSEYGDNRLTFNSLQLDETGGGMYSGKGYLPLELDFATGEIRLLRDTAMNLQFHGDTQHLQFLEQYIKDLDGVSGTCAVDLEISGTPNKPIRDGSAAIKDGILEISQLENEITGVDAAFTLRNNMMTVDHFSGYMHDTQHNEIIEGFLQKVRHWITGLFTKQPSSEKPNLFVEGTLDFSKFFKPALNLRVDGNDIYIRTLLSEVEGLVNTDITLVGRDTLRITGDFEVAEEVVLRKEFTKREFPKEIEPTGKKGQQVEINLHADFPGNVYIKNGQLNAEFEGEIWLIQHGNEPMNISGSLNVLNGKFYYYNDTFTIEEGEISFDPVDLNPRVNVVATTQIEKEPIRITLTGELDNPNIALESTGNTNLSESDILSLLTFNSQVEQKGLVSPEIQSIFTTYLERQLENYGTKLMGLETFEVETQGQGLQDLQQVSITVGQRVSPNLYFLYGRDFSAVNPGNRLGLEYRVNKYVSFVGEIDEDGLYHFNYRLKYNY